MPETLLTVVETNAFARKADKLLGEEEHEELLLYLSKYYAAGDEIPGTGGVRRLRFAAFGRGKSGGVRAIYYFYDANHPLYAIFLYGKNEQADLTSAQKKEARELASIIKAAATTRRSQK